MVRQESPYVSKCMNSWNETSYGEFIPKDESGDFKPGWNYTLPVRDTNIKFNYGA